MSTLKIEYCANLKFSRPVTDHHFALRCVPVTRPGQNVLSSSLKIFPDASLFKSCDYFGNICHSGFCKEPHEEFGFNMNALVQVEIENGILEPCLPLYKYQSRLTFCDAKMQDFCKSIFERTPLKIFAEQKKIPSHLVKKTSEILLCAVNSFVSYAPHSTNISTTAAQVFEMKKGVCQDYAHLFCSLCRFLGIAARYVFGATKGEGATHAWAQVFVPDENFLKKDGTQILGRWFGIDPARNKWCDNTYAAFGVGRDFFDCQVDRGVFCGGADQSLSVFVKACEQ